MSVTKSPFLRRPMLDRDLEAYERILHSAFDGGIMTFMFPHGSTRKDIDHSIANTKKKLHDPHSVVRYQIIIDTTAQPEPSDLANLSPADAEAARNEGRAVSFSVWNIYDHDRSDEEIAAEAAEKEKEGFGPSMDPAFCEDFFGLVGKCKKEIIGHRAYVLLHILATDPAYHRRGLGGLSLEWGLAEADRLGVPAYLEGSRMGVPLYQRYGFEVVRRLPFDWDKYVGKGGDSNRYEHMLMLRPSRKLVNGASWAEKACGSDEL